MVLPLQCGSRSAARLLLKWAGAPDRRRAILKRAARGRRLFIPRKDLDQVGRWARAHQGIFSIPGRMGPKQPYPPRASCIIAPEKRLPVWSDTILKRGRSNCSQQAE